MDLLEIIPTAQRVLKHYKIDFLSPKEWAMLIQYGSLKSFKKGEKFISANQLNSKIAFILSGAFRFYTRIVRIEIKVFNLCVANVFSAEIIGFVLPAAY